MATAKQWLLDLGFDPAKGRILLHWWPKNESGYDDRSIYGDKAGEQIEFVTIDHQRMTQDFSDGYGGNNSPDFVAEDADFLYIVGTYDGASWLTKVAKNISYYVEHPDNVPCIGGG